jgi:hypothetical protein
MQEPPPPQKKKKLQNNKYIISKAIIHILFSPMKFYGLRKNIKQKLTLLS